MISFVCLNYAHLKVSAYHNLLFFEFFVHYLVDRILPDLFRTALSSFSRITGTPISFNTYVRKSIFICQIEEEKKERRTEDADVLCVDVLRF